MSTDYFKCLYNYVNCDLDEENKMRFYNCLVTFVTQKHVMINVPKVVPKGVTKQDYSDADKKQRTAYLSGISKKFKLQLTDSNKKILKRKLGRYPFTFYDVLAENYFTTLDKNFVTIALSKYILLLNKVSSKKDKNVICMQFDDMLTNIGYNIGILTELDDGYYLCERPHHNRYFNQDIAFIYYHN